MFSAICSSIQEKAAMVEVNISLAFLHWVGIALHPWPFVSDIAIFVLKGDVKLQLIQYTESLNMLPAVTDTQGISAAFVVKSYGGFSTEN